MDGIIFISYALFLTIWVLIRKPELETATTEIPVESEDVTREARINDIMYHDDNAFMGIANRLGFRR